MAHDDAQIAQVLERLRTKLLDLTTRNGMLSFKHPKASCLRVADELPGQMFEDLMAGKKLEFSPVAEPSPIELAAYNAKLDNGVVRAGSPTVPKKPAADQWADHLGINVNYDLAIETDSFERAERHKDKKIQTLLYYEGLDTRIRKLKADATTAIQESGANMLYLAFGFLQWKDGDNGRENIAPLVLMPVSLERERDVRTGKFRFYIERINEDIQDNLSLRKKLEEFGLALPEIDADEGLDTYLSRVRTTIKDRHGWMVRRYVSLSLFQFGKILLYLDLDPAKWPAARPLTSHPVVRRMLSADAIEDDFGQHNDQDGDPSEELKRCKAFDLDLALVDKADSSQGEALSAALSGQNIVIQGPPGTGKSQTITNLIAAALEAGKTVLFVAEKLAALEVVQRRLRELGLGEFCLELHSNKTRKTDFHRDIAVRLNSRGRNISPSVMEDAWQRLIERRNRLSRYVAIMSSPAGRYAGLTVSEALMQAGRSRRKLGDAIFLLEQREISIDSVPETQTELDDLKANLETLRKAAKELKLARPVDHPWAGVSAHAIRPYEAAKIVELATTWATTAEHLDEQLVGSGWEDFSHDVLRVLPAALTAVMLHMENSRQADSAASIVEDTLSKACGHQIKFERSAQGLELLSRLIGHANSKPKTNPAKVPAFASDPTASAFFSKLRATIGELRQSQEALKEIFRSSAFTSDPEDIETWSAAFQQTGLFARFGKRWKQATDAWNDMARPSALKKPPVERAAQLEALQDYVLKLTAFENDGGVKTHLGGAFQGLETDLEEAILFAAWCDNLRSSVSDDYAPTLIKIEESERLKLVLQKPFFDALAQAGFSTALGEEIGGQTFWSTVLSARTIPQVFRQLPRHTDHKHWQELLENAENWAAAITQFKAAEEAFQQKTALRGDIWFDSQKSPSLKSVSERATRAILASDDLNSWLEFDRAFSACEQGKAPKVAWLAANGELNLSLLSEAARFVTFDRLASDVFNKEPSLNNLGRLTLDAARQEYREMDEKVMELRRDLIATRLRQKLVPAGVRSGVKSNLSERALLEHECSKTTRHLALRQLMTRAGSALKAIKPCFMMGPLSVAQYLGRGEMLFDLVIMDEASQMRPEDAIGALARGKQAIIVGDSKQLPPTSFFDRIGVSTGDEDEIEDDQTIAEDSESILETAEKLFRTHSLLWHYRSRHEALIAFSNRRFYDGRLIVFPSPKGQSDRFGIGWNFVESGRASKGLNDIEARAVAKAAADFLKKERGSGRSLGVVAMNVNQATRISDELAKLEETDRELSDARVAAERGGRGEPFFIKNLENVQGDERDVIMMSMTYGPDPVTGRTAQRFGPISQSTGWRRLNVLFTRAKERMEVFSSMRAVDIDPGDQSSEGPKALKAFLDYAGTGQLGYEPIKSARPTGSDFEDAVLEGLLELGYECEPQVGVANYFLDIAIRDPDVPTEYIAAVECDGATYHSSKSARDRDRLRQEVLEGLGWSFIRIWSTDWFRDPNGELNRVNAALKARIEQVRALRLRCTPKMVETITRVSEAHLADDQILDEVQLLEAEQPTKSGRGSKQMKLGMTSDQARAELIDLRESEINPMFPDVDRSRGFLRKSMLDELVRARPTTLNEFQSKVRRELREATDGQQLQRFKDQVFEILDQISD
jgi:very-short-patch-repair endonuclease